MKKRWSSLRAPPYVYTDNRKSQFSEKLRKLGWFGNFAVKISPGHAAGVSVMYQSGGVDQDDCLRDVGIFFGMR